MVKQIKKYFIKTYGCQMNEAESEQIAMWYELRGWEKVKTWKEADEVVINSCSVREAAENRVFGLVNNINKFRVRSRESGGMQKLEVGKPRVILTGCMVGSALGERKRFTLKQLKKRMLGVVEFKPWWKWGFEGLQAFGTRKDKKRAFVPIMKGCNHFCTYCVVPYSKGKESSFSFEDIVCRVEELAKQGWEEVVLLGQNVNSYNGGFGLLLQAIYKIEGINKISFMTSNPWDLTNDIIETMKLPKISREFHLPVQSGDDAVLKKMNRPYTAIQYIKLVEKIRKEIPNIEISTDIIVGFPGETKKAFENTVKLCKKVGFKRTYVAMYSARPGTAASKLVDDVPHSEKRRRWRVLEELINS